MNTDQYEDMEMSLSIPPIYVQEEKTEEQEIELLCKMHGGYYE
jgi:hypothetical protein